MGILPALVLSQIFASTFWRVRHEMSLFRAANQAFETKTVKKIEGSDCTKQVMLFMEQSKCEQNEYHIFMASNHHNKKYFDVLVLIIVALAIILGYELLFKQNESKEMKDYVVGGAMIVVIDMSALFG